MKSELAHVLFLLCAICVCDADIVETVSVIEGDSVTLHTDVTEIQKDDVIEWRLNRYLIARISGGVFSTEGASGDRLQLDKQTGDITITNIKTTDSGEYILKIKNPRGSSEKTFSVSVVSGVDEVKSVSLTVGDSVTLNSGTIIQRDDVIEWRFGDLNSLIAEHNRKTGNFSTSDVPDGRFRDRLQLDYSTGSLTIRNTSTEHSGLYEASIRKSRHTIHKSYNVTASGDREKKSVSVKKGYSVTLHTDLTEIQTDDFMQWMFEDTVIAHKQSSTSDGPDGRFGDRLKLDPQTGSLTITHTTNTDSGLYELKISSSRFIINRRITVTVTDPGLSPGDVAGIAVGLLACVAAAVVVVAAVVAGVIYYRYKISELNKWIYNRTMLSVMVGETITLNPDEEHKDDKLLWMFRGSCIAERKSAAHSLTLHDDLPDERFKGRLELNPQTGSLTITDTRTTDTGVYEVLTTRPGNTSIKRFNVSVFTDRDTDEIKTKSVKNGGSVTLETGVTDMEKVEQIQWKFGLHIRLAEITRGTKIISPIASKILDVKLELDHQTGSLTIKNTRPTDAGIYMLRKIEEGNIKTILFKVKVSDPTDNRNNSEEVPLNSVL